MHAAADVVGLGFFAFLAFFAPLGVMRYAWKQIRAMEGKPEHARGELNSAQFGPLSPEEPATRKVA
jgi:hypothetical protein